MNPLSSTTILTAQFSRSLVLFHVQLSYFHISHSPSSLPISTLFFFFMISKNIFMCRKPRKIKFKSLFSEKTFYIKTNGAGSPNQHTHASNKTQCSDVSDKKNFKQRLDCAQAMGIKIRICERRAKNVLHVVLLTCFHPTNFSGLLLRRYLMWYTLIIIIIIIRL